MTEIDTIGTARNQLRTAIVDFQPTLRAALRWPTVVVHLPH